MMKIKNIFKKGKLLIVVFVIYAVFFVLNKEIFSVAVSQSSYFIKEIISIMPIIVGMIILIDVWLPRKVIEKHMGVDSKIKGVIFAFALGSLSAGPIYAAFPIAKALEKKGASIKNVVIIISSWAVIKVPMLVNEVKFLGVKFMVIRWILTIIGIYFIGVLVEKVMESSSRQVVDKVES